MNAWFAVNYQKENLYRIKALLFRGVESWYCMVTVKHLAKYITKVMEGITKRG